MLSTSCFAQSSVTLYGSLDMGVDFNTNSKGQHLIQEVAGKRQPDRFGFLIREDIGGGTAAIARLESGFLTGTGASISPTSFFNRYAYVGLTNASYGTLTMGNIPDYVYEYIGALNNAVPGISSFYTTGNLDGLANTHAMNNAIKYDSPVYYGFQFGAMNAFGNQAGDFSSGRQYSIGAKYWHGPAKVGIAYSVSHNRTADLFGIFGESSVLGQKLGTGVLFNADKYSTLAIAGSYQIGRFLPHLTYTDVKLANSRGSVRERNYQGGVNIDLTGTHEYIFGLSYNRSIFQDLTFNQYNAFLDWYLSKRTELYAGVGLERASGPSAHAAQFGYQVSTSNSQTIGRVGIHHLF
ncbi:porin [Paraburkholderia sp. MPAMCS5]|uniref:porin n=1 Tax=Paraburkholderia sp. MPAMCS5 TaxID=3112563 RepID=UPI002E1895A1|nr:porin [Paraburkholderia sp. MPAMCS5]